MSRVSAILLLALVGLGGCGGAPDDTDRAVSGPGGGLSGDVHGLVDVPLSARRFPALSAYGDLVLVMGGQSEVGGIVTQLGDGAVLDTATGEWTPVPAAPTSAPIYQPVIAWSDGGFLVAGAVCNPVEPGPSELIDVCSPRFYESAFFRLDTNSWEPIPELPQVPWDGPVTLSAALHEDSAMFQFGESYGSQTVTSVLAANGGSWSDGEWESVEDLGLSGLCATDFGMVAFLPEDGAIGVRILDGAGWRSIGSAPFDLPGDEFVPACGPTEAVVLIYGEGPEPPTWLLDLRSGEWRDLGASPASIPVPSNIAGEAAGATLDGMSLAPSGRIAEWPLPSTADGPRPNMGDEAPSIDEANGEWLDKSPDRYATTTTAAIGLYEEVMELAIVGFDE